MSTKITIAFTLLLFAMAGTLPAQNLKATLKMTRGWCKQMGGDQSWPPDPTWKTRANIKTGPSDTGVNGELCRFLDNYAVLASSSECLLDKFLPSFPGICYPREKIYDDVILTYQPSSYNFSLNDGFYVTINMEAWEDDKGGICDYNSGDDDYGKKDSTFWARLPNGATLPYHFNFTLQTNNSAFRVSYRLTIENLDAISNTSLRVANSAGTTQSTFCSGDPVRLYADRRTGFSGGYFEWQRRNTPSSSWVSATATTYTTSNFLGVTATSPMPDYRVRVGQSGSNGTATGDDWIMVSGATITVAPAPPALADIITTPTGSCEGSGSSGAITVSINNAVATASYALTLLNNSNVVVANATLPASASPMHTFTGLAPGTYKVTVTLSGGAVGCSTQKTGIVVASLPRPVISASGAAGTCAGNNGTLTVNITGNATGSNVYTLLASNGVTVLDTWTTSATTHTFSRAAGTYKVRVVNGNGCNSLVSNDVVIPTPPAAVTAGLQVDNINGTGYQIRCIGGLGEIRITPSGGTPPYSIHVSGGGSQSNVPSGALTPFYRPAGSYTITISDSRFCEFNTSVVLTEPPSQPGITPSNFITSSDCAPTGGVTLTGTGGVGPYQFSMDNPNGPYTTNGVFSGLSAGEHYAYVRDAAGCQRDIYFVIDAVNPLYVVPQDVTQVLCAGSANGAVTLMGIGGNPPYQFRIGNGSFSSNNTFSGLSAGTYTFEIRDADFCTGSVSVNVAAPNAIIVTGHTLSDPDCYDPTQRSFSISLTGRADGNAGFDNAGLEISLDNGATYEQFSFYESYDDGVTMQMEFFNQPMGTFQVIVRDADNCTSAPYTLVSPPAQNLSLTVTEITHETCAGANDGAITVTFSGGVAPYYLRLIRPISSDEFDELEVFGPVSQTGAHTFTGIPAITIANGVGYFVEIRDRLGNAPWDYRCSELAPPHPGGPYLPGQGIYINANTPFNPGTPQSTGPQLNCYGDNGVVTITGASGGMPPYQYSADGFDFQSSNVFSGLGAQNSFYVRDSRGCTQGPINITIPSAPVTLNATATLTEPETYCTKGAIQVNISGGTGPFEVALIQDGDCLGAYLYAAITSSTSIPFTELSAGNYTICIRDAGGCRADRSITVPLAAEPAMTITNVQNTTCFDGGNNGAITLQASGGTPPYTITINNGAPQTGGMSTNFNFSGLAAGSYLFQLSDSKGCTDILVGNVPSNNLLSASVDADAVSGCAGGSTGVIRAIPYDGVAPYTVTWLWDNVTVSGVAENQIVQRTGLPAGVYQVRITDAIGCQRTEIEIVETPLPLSANVFVTDALCSNVLNGFVTVNATGGWEVYEYALNGGSFQTDNFFENLAPGNYTVTVRDTSNCVANFPFTVGLQRVINANATPTNPACFGQTNGSIAIAAVGGGAPYTYSVNGGAFLPGNPITGLGGGTYTVTLRDNGGCEFTINGIQLTEPPQLNASASVTQDATCSSNTGILQAAATGGTPGYSYQWDGNPALNSATYNNAPPGPHTVVITDSRGCTAQATASISNIPAVTLNLVGTTNELCGQADGTATVAVQGGMAPFNYTWSHNAGLNSPMATGLTAGPYSVTVTDGNNCTAVRNLTVAETISVSLSVNEVKNSFCTEGNGRITVSPVGGVAPFSYTWSHNAGLNSPIANNLNAGTYSVTVTDGNGCGNTASAMVNFVPGPTASASASPASCQGNTGSVQVMVQGGAAPFQYSWSHNAGLNSNIASNLPAGPYMVTVTDANNCTFTASATVTELPPPTVFVNTTTATCGLPNGSAQAVVAGGTAPYTYFWSGGNPSSPIAQNLAPGNYSLTIVDAFGCQATANFTIGNIPGPTGLAVSFQNSICQNFTGSITVTPQGGTGPFSYAWSHNAFLNQPTASLLAAGTYSVTATDANGCTVSATQVILFQGPPVLQTVQQVNSLCANGNGVIEISATGTGPFMYAWTNGVSTGPLAQNLNAGSYTVTVTDANGCTATRNFTISLAPAPSLQLLQITNDVCGQGLGQIRVRGVGGASPYTFSWSHNAILNSDWPTGLTAGTYSVTVTDQNGCTATGNYTVGETPGPGIFVVSTGTAFCNAATGSVLVNVSGGLAPFTYSWSHSPGLNSSFVNNLLPGVYTISVTDANNCSNSVQATVNGTTPPTLSLLSSTDDPCVLNDVSIIVSTAGGVAPLTYSWSHNPALNSPSASGLATGTYTVSVTDVHGCQNVLNTSVTDRRGPVLAVAGVTGSTCGFSDGSITVTASLGQTPYTFSWSHNAALNSATANNLAAGSYSVTVTDVNGCTAVVSASVSDAQGPQIVVQSQTDAICTPNSGSIQVSVSAGSGPYNYAWSHNAGLNSPVANGLSAGAYSVTATDANGCQAITSATIGFQAPPMATAIATHAVCSPNTGSITVSVSGGAPPYGIQWNFPNLNGFTVSPLFAGSYEATVTDANGCSVTVAATVNFIAGPSIIPVQVQNAACGQSTGLIDIGVVNGLAPYTYAWSHNPNLQFFIASGLAAGTYSVTVTDANHCTATFTTAIADLPGPTLSFSAVNSACGQNNGSASISATGGVLPLHYAWSHNAGLNSPNAAGLSPGLYSATVTDAAGCSSTVEGEVSDEGGVSVAIASAVNALCDANSGSISLTAIDGQAPYTYTWSHNAGLNSPNATGLGAGAYTATVTDADGCQDVISQTLSFTAGPTLALQSSTNSLCENGNGALSFSTTGGTAAYTYQWSHNAGLNTATATGLNAGSYTLSVTDANGCTASQQAQVQLIAGPQLSLAGTTDTYCGNEAGAVTVNVAGGATPLQYFWSHNPGLNAATATGLSAGSYGLTVSDANGCVAELAATVNDLPGFAMNDPAVQSATCGNDNGQIQLTPNGGQAPFQYQWSHDAGLSGPNAANLPVGIYTIDITDATGCEQSLTIALQTADGPVLAISGAQNASCGLNNGSIGTSLSGGQAPFTYLWSNGSGGSALSNLPGGAYQVSVTDGNGCVGVAFATIAGGSTPTLQILNLTETECVLPTGAIQLGSSGGQFPYTYTWSHDAGLNSAFANGLAAGTYSATVTDAAGCTAVRSAEVEQNTDISIALLQTVNALCASATGSATVSGLNGQSPYNYSWSHDATVTTAAAGNLPPGTYSVIATDAAGCSAQLSLSVGSQMVPIALSVAQNTASACNAPTGSISLSPSGGTGPYTFAWSHSAAVTTANAGNLAPGAYSATATDANGCVGIATATVLQTAPPQLVLVQTTDTDCGQATGSVEVNASGGAGPYTYAWSHNPGVTGNIAAGLAADNYAITTTDINGCTATLNATVSESGAPDVTILTTNSYCAQATGSAMVPEVGNFTYEWENTAQPGTILSVNATAGNLAAGTYSVTVTNDQGCSALRIAVVQDLPDMVVSATASPALCFGTADGSASAAVTAGGTGPFVFQWSNNQSGETVSGLSAGGYQVSVTDGNGCMAVVPVVVTEPALLAVNLTGSTPPACGASLNGTIAVLVSGGTFPYQYNWESGQQTASISGLAAGTYQLTATDANGCQATFQTTLNAAGTLSFTVNATAQSCAGLNNGQAVATVSGPGPFTYQWNTPGNPTGSSVNNLAPGTYSVTVSDGGGCASVQSFSVAAAQPINLQLTSTPSCLNELNGTATASASGGAGGFLYNWSNNLQGGTIFNLLPGVFTVTATDANSCTSVETVVVEAAPFPTIVVDNVMQPDCLGQTTGTAQVSATGGTGAISFVWSDPAGQTGPIASNLTPGAYTVIATDQNGCSATTSVDIEAPADFTPTVAGVVRPSCFGDGDGSATVTVQGGSGNFNYQWNDPQNQTGAQATNLSAGNYTVIITDTESGCSATLPVTVQNPALLELNLTNTTAALCNGQSNGTATVAATGGTGAYNYLWNDPAGQTTATATGLAAGTYQVAVTDLNGCTVTLEVQIADPPVLEAEIGSFSAPLCFGQNDGTASVNVMGGTGAYSYQWNDPALQTTATAGNLPPGNYMVMVRDVNNCSTTASVVIPATPNIVVTVTDETDPACAGQDNGSLAVTAAGGTGTLNYQWSSGQNTPAISGLPAGNYTVSVTDANNCLRTLTLNLQDADALNLGNVVVTQTTCYSGADASISVTVQGGTGSYTYLWSDPAGQTGATATGLARGDYSVTATDGNGCTLIADFTVTSAGQQIFINPAVNNASCEGAANATITLSASGGAGGFSFAWGGGQTGNVLANLGAGTYTATATDATGCTETTSVTVTEGAAFVVDLGSPDTTLCDGEVLFVDFSHTNYSVQWTSLTGFSSLARLTALDRSDTYYLQVTNAQGCVARDTIRVTVMDDPLQAFFIIPTDVVVGQEVVALEGSWPIPSQVNWFFPADSVQLLRREGDQFYFLFTQAGNVQLRMQSILGNCEDWIVKTVTVHTDSTTIPGLNPDEPDILGVTIAPNPNMGNFNVEVLLSAQRDIILTLYDINGAIQERRTRQGQSTYTENYTLSGQPGTYFLIVQSPKQRRSFAVVVVSP